MNAIIKRLAARRSTSRGDEAGLAMIMVILVSVILLTVPIALATAAVGQLPLTRRDQDSTSALAAAEAGVDDYVNRLNANSTYWNTSVANTTNGTPPSPSDGNKALTGWVAVGDTTPGGLVEGYCYTVDMSGTSGHYTASSTITQVQGIVQIDSYGYSAAGGSLPAAAAGANPCAGPVPRGGVERMVQVNLRQQGFLDNLELTDLQLADQGWFNQQYGTNVTGCANNPGAGYYVYYWSHNNKADCTDLDNYWGTGQVLNGAIRSNDDYYICGTPQFNAPIESDDPHNTTGVNGGPYWADPAHSCGTDAPDFDNPGYNGTPATEGSITSNPSLIQFPQTDTTQKQLALNGGCYYVGPTDIVLSGSGTTATMTVVSPLTTSNSVPSGYNPSPCLGTNIALPSNRIIYVDSTTNNCSAVFGTNLNWALVGMPSGDVCTSSSSPGDLFISGTLGQTSTGQQGLTISVADNVYIDGDVRDASTAMGSPQLLGIIANNYIEVVHAMSGSTQVKGYEPFYGSTSGPGCVGSATCIASPADYGSSACASSNSGQSGLDCKVTVDAALLALNHSVGVQNFADNRNYNPGNNSSYAFGTLVVYGALAQEYMDITGVFSGGCSYTTQGVSTELCTGMNSDYTYDPRFAHNSPPHFLAPQYAEWNRLTFEECPLSGCQS